MPQMSPINWLNLYFMFTLLMNYLISYIHFSKNINNSNYSIKINSQFKYNWLW